MMFSRPLAERNKSKSRVKSVSKPHQKSPLSFKPKTKQIVDVPSLISLNKDVLLAGGQVESTFDIVPLQELFEEAGKRVVNCKIVVKGESIPNCFWLGDPQSLNLYQTFDTCLISTPTKMKIVGRCPEVSVTTEVSGILQLSFEGIQRTLSIPVKMVCEVPKIVCLTNLQNINKGYSVIRLPVKNKRLSPMIPFKNDSSIDLSFQVKLLGNEQEGFQKYQLLTPKFIRVKKEEKFHLQLDIKENPNYQGPNPQIYTLRKLIQLKLPGCNQFFTFPLEVLVYEMPQAL